nr:MAG TPA: tail completion protein [Caudoviricetes sp.]
MRLEELKTLLGTTGLPVTYRAWPENDAPPMPYICYLVTYSNNFGADNRVYHKIDHIQVELYTKLKDPEAEDRVENALSSLYWDKTEEYIDSERCYQILYEIEV